MLLDIRFFNNFFLNKQSNAVNEDMEIFKCICMGNMLNSPIMYISLISDVVTGL
jgi:hypothetical protein